MGQTGLPGLGPDLAGQMVQASGQIGGPDWQVMLALLCFKAQLLVALINLACSSRFLAIL